MSYSNSIHPHCSDAIEYDLTSICGSGLDVESRNDISRSMARDSSSNKIFLVSFQMSFYVVLCSGSFFIIFMSTSRNDCVRC